MGDLRNSFPVLFTLSHRSRRISERYDCNHVQFIWYAEQRLYIMESHEAHPIRANSFRPRRQNHRLNRSRCIRERELRSFNSHDDRQWRLRNVWTSARDSTQLIQCVLVIDNNEMPWLTVHGASGQSSRLDDAANHIGWHLSR